MKFFYQKNDPRHVKFQRIIMGWLAISSLFFREVDLIWLFFAISLLGLFTGSELSIVTLFYKLFYAVFKRHLVSLSTHHLRYYQINRPMDLIDHILRIIASSAALILYYSDLEIIAWGAMTFLSVFMMLSAYFGFCLSALTYILLENLRFKCRKSSKDQSASWCSTSFAADKKHLNEKCILAQRCFTPYKRCDNCHTNISQCLGTKFNSVVILIGLLLGSFLFITNPLFIQINILIIMALIFWLGYQMNYSTDDLADSNDKNIILNDQLKRYTLSLEDEVKRRTAEIEHLATHDMLTGLLNRFSFEKSLNETLKELDESKSTHLAFIDLDKFKEVNDTAGHLAGDALLRKISAMFTECVKDRGVIARLGGDEFAIILKHMDATEALACCQKICDKVASYAFVWEDHTFTVGASIGLVTIKSSMQDIKAVVHHADQACYLAKKSGRNQVCVSQS